MNTGASSEPSVLNYLNLLAFKLQYAYMKKKITNEKVTLHSAFFHPRPTGKIVIKEYKAKLRTVLKGVGFRTSSSDLIGTTSTNVEASSEPSMSTKILITGCFDVLHEEHKKFLKAAKKFKVPNLKFSPQSHHLRGEVAPAVHLGGVSPNILLVGLETDVRVKKLKGKNRPINPINTRIKNLKKWGIADQIFSLPEKFDNPTDHLKLLKKIRPDILAVSAHTPNLPAKRKLMKQIGGSVIVVHPHNPKLSTTKILKYKVRHYSEKELQKFIRNDKII